MIFLQLLAQPCFDQKLEATHRCAYNVELVFVDESVSKNTSVIFLPGILHGAQITIKQPLSLTAPKTDGKMISFKKMSLLPNIFFGGNLSSTFEIYKDCAERFFQQISSHIEHIFFCRKEKNYYSSFSFTQQGPRNQNLCIGAH